MLRKKEQCKRIVSSKKRTIPEGEHSGRNKRNKGSHFERFLGVCI